MQWRITHVHDVFFLSGLEGSERDENIENHFDVTVYYGNPFW